MSEKNLKETNSSKEVVSKDTQEERKILTTVVIYLHEDGSIAVDGHTENGEKTNLHTIEAITHRVSNELRDSRVANMAIEMFKNKLGG